MFRVIAIAVLLPVSLTALPRQSSASLISFVRGSAPSAAFASAQELAGKGRLDAAMRSWIN